MALRSSNMVYTKMGKAQIRTRANKEFTFYRVFYSQSVLYSHHFLHIYCWKGMDVTCNIFMSLDFVWCVYAVVLQKIVMYSNSKLLDCHCLYNQLTILSIACLCLTILLEYTVYIKYCINLKSHSRYVRLFFK